MFIFCLSFKLVYVILASKGYQTCCRENWGRSEIGDGMEIDSVKILVFKSPIDF